MKSNKPHTSKLEVECLEDRNQPSCMSLPSTVTAFQLLPSGMYSTIDDHSTLNFSKSIIDTKGWAEGLRVNHNQTLVRR